MSALATLLVTLLVLAALPLPYGIGGSSMSSLRRAPVTALLVGLNVAVFLDTHLSWSHGLVEPLAAFDEYGLVSADVHPRDLVTYEFLHISGAHLLWNMIYLYLFGPSVEEKVGSVLYAALYLLGGAAAGLINSVIVMHVAANSSAAYVPVVGASGAISAVLGLFAIFAARRPLKLFWAMGYLTSPNRSLLQIPAIFGIGLWLVQTVYGASASLVNHDASGVAYFTHIGGFLVGLGLGALAKQARKFAGPGYERRTLNAASGAENGQAAAYDLFAASAANTDPMADPAERGAGVGLIGLLGRALDDCDMHRADSLHAKCRAMGLVVPQSLVERLNGLRNSANLASDGSGSVGEAMVPEKH